MASRKTRETNVAGAGSGRNAAGHHQSPTEPTAIAVRDPSPALVEQSSALTDWLQVRAVSTQAERETAVATLRAVKAILTLALAEKESVFRPIKTALDTWTAKCKRVIEPLENVEAHIKRIVGSYDQEQALKERLAAEKAAKQAEKKGNEQLATDIRQMAVAAPMGTPADGLTYRSVRKAVIADREQFWHAVVAGVVPDAVIVKMLDAATPSLTQLVKAGLVIPGVALVEEKVAQVSLG